jgi:hypothetical protein
MAVYMSMGMPLVGVRMVSMGMLMILMRMPVVFVRMFNHSSILQDMNM